MNIEIKNNMLSYYSEEYEQFLGLNLNNIELELELTGEETIRYIKQLSFWEINLDEIEKSNANYIQSEIDRLCAKIQYLFPFETVQKIMNIAMKTSKFHQHLIDEHKEYFTPHEIQNYINQQLINSNNT